MEERRPPNREGLCSNSTGVAYRAVSLSNILLFPTGLVNTREANAPIHKTT